MNEQLISSNMDLIQKALNLGYEKHSGFTGGELDRQSINSIYKQIEYFLIQKWLREKHSIICSINYHANNKRIKWGYSIYKYDTNSLIHLKDYPYNTYEESLENALQESFKLI
jgi:hypothetical protein